MAAAAAAGISAAGRGATPRERAAIERHVERALAPAPPAPGPPPLQPRRDVAEMPKVPEGVDLEQWVRGAATGQERAQRARAAARVRCERELEKERAAMCIFEAPHSDTKDTAISRQPFGELQA